MGNNITDKRLAKLWNNGNKSINSLARKIGRPGDLIRVIEGLEREKLINGKVMRSILRGLEDAKAGRVTEVKDLDKFLNDLSG